MSRAIVTRHPGTSVVICAYTEARWDDLVTAVDAVQRQTTPPAEIIVVADHNPQLLCRLRTQLPAVIAVENTGPRGLSASRNSGIAVAQGAIIVFLDDDAVPADDWLSSLIAAYDDPAVVGVGGAVEPRWQGRRQRPAWFPPEFDWVVGCTYQGMPQITAPVRNLIGCNMSFRREVFERVAVFQSGIGRVGTRPLGCEETEICIAISQRCPGTVLLYVPRARVQHRVPPERMRWAYFRARCHAEGLSKALVARAVGAGDGLASERAYTLRTLPRGVVRGLVDAARHGDLAGLARAGAIVAGLAITTLGYLKGSSDFRLRRGKGCHNPATSGQPAQEGG